MRERTRTHAHTSSIAMCFSFRKYSTRNGSSGLKNTKKAYMYRGNRNDDDDCNGLTMASSRSSHDNCSTTQSLSMWCMECIGDPGVRGLNSVAVVVAAVVMCKGFGKGPEGQHEIASTKGSNSFLFSVSD